MTKDASSPMTETEKVFYTRIGEFLKHHRLAKGHSAKKVGDAVPVSLVSIQKYEAATVRVPLWALKQICEFLGVPLIASLKHALNQDSRLPEKPSK